ncbi:hypothetical protein [Streptomyces sp. ALB3]
MRNNYYPWADSIQPEIISRVVDIAKIIALVLSKEPEHAAAR